MREVTIYRTPLLTLDPNATAGGGLVEVVKLADHDAALRRAKAEVLELATKELCMYCNDPGNWAPMSNSGYHQCNTPGPNMVRCHATKIHALIREIDARAAQIEEGE